MDKNTIIGLVLIVAVLLGFSFFNSPKQQPVTASAPQEQVAQTPAATPVVPVAAQIDSTALFADCRVMVDSATGRPAEAGFVTLKNDNVIVRINRRGGVVSRVSLTGYRSYDDFKADRTAPLELYSDSAASTNLAIKTQREIINTRDYVFDAVEQKDSTQVTLRLTARDGSRLDLRYHLLPGDNYMMNFDVVTAGMTKHIADNEKHIAIDWKQKIKQHEKGYDFENQYSTLTYKLTGEGTEHLPENGDKNEHAEGAVDWIAFKGQYFSTVLIAPITNFDDVDLNSRQIAKEATGTDAGCLKDYAATMKLPMEQTAQGARMQYYFGPNSFNLLKSMDDHRVGTKELDLEDLVYLGWPLFRWINRFFTIYVFDFLTALGLPMGIVLLLITLLLRVIVYVPTKKSFLSSARMRVLKPKVDEISRKYPNKEDAMKKQQEMMSLYSQYGVSPMGGCLPMLIQMPIWIAMFNFVPNAIELRQQGFLWADDLSTYDSVLEFGTQIWGIGDHLSLFCLLFCATNLVYSFMTIRQQRESMSGEQAQQMKMMQWMMYLMPVMFFFMFNRYSAGLNYYYFISLLASALTMWYLRRTTDDARLLAKLEENYRANKNNPNKKPSGLAARLEALQKQQQAMMEAQKRK